MSPDAAGLAAASAALQSGGVVLVPTDTVYGLAACAGDPAAVGELFVLKRRPHERSIALIVADLVQANELAHLGPGEMAVASQFWPGALTLVVKRRAGVDAGLGRADGTIALRLPDHDFIRALAREVGPLATTSANVSGEPTPAEAHEAAASLAREPDVVIDAGACAGSASTVARIDAAGGAHLLRDGPISRASIVAVLEAKELRGK